MVLVLIRHGRPEWHVPFLCSLAQFERMSAGYDATHLSSEGVKAIEALAKRLPEYHILSSDLARARETAQIIGRGNDKIEFAPLFRELQASCIATNLVGKLWAPSIVWSLVHWCCWALGIGQCPEWPRAAWNRATRAAHEILTYLEAGENIILVSHGWFITLLALHLRRRGLIEHGPLVPKISYGATTRYDLTERCINRLTL